MDNKKTPIYYINKIIDDIFFVLKKTRNISIEEFSENDILNCAVSFKFIQISESAKQLPETLMSAYPMIPWKKLMGYEIE